MAERAAGDIAHPEVSREPRDVSVSGVAIFLGSLLVLAIVIHLLLWGMLQAMIAERTRSNPSAAPLAEPGRLPPPPRLQIDPPQELKALRLQEDALLNSFGWVDRSAGIVRIPIERAMELTIAEHRLPVRAAQPQSQPAENEKQSEGPR
ncbi:MAG TPA: hypothetical protein VGM03_21250 [Phycisphaerae bacterium]|jgi:hypothetical protein